ncbi:ABC-type glycerol-3-phosphate transport system, substrate-binding protein [Caldanaerobius fijiensis DSM 17918]|uniref:ABC-type glycerol-3-phosphate transport system, substrate-binding protein n=1 Tax=Caldanaerobius fijiensis DSM 17918 TaxID=1121256 RepID=A0A1M5FNW7_9THEO|nr:ABC transporter substrate-binding protein [Caldanaerobius fijiensis]SHF93186.1 ABC-type glycerol-3-phosphate transport system, substrate-binding protein [Caldanaerobius fijiensis DSM 17918]
MLSKRKIITLLLMIFMIASMVTGCSSRTNSSTANSAGKTRASNLAEKNPEDYKGTIVLWSFTDEPKYMIEKFNKVYPNIKVQFTQMPFNDYITKMKSVLQAGVGVPDVFSGEIQFVKIWSETDYWENLSAPPYNADKIAANMVPYVVKLGSDEKGNIRALSWQATPGGFWYRRSLAKKYFGTDDPDKISQMMSTMSGLFDMGKKIYQESGGKIHLLANWGDLQSLQYAIRKNPWVKDNTLFIDPEMMKVFDLAKEARDNNIEAKINSWTPAWAASMAQGTVFGYFIPSWGLQFVLKVNAPKTSGDWALATGPAHLWGGGTWFGIYSKSQKKDLAWQFVKFVTSNEDYLRQYVKDKGDFISYVPIIKEFANSDSFKEPFLGGQNYYKVLSKEAQYIDASVITKYDANINTFFGNAVGLYVDGKKSKGDAINQFKKDVKNAYPDIKVD